MLGLAKRVKAKLLLASTSEVYGGIVNVPLLMIIIQYVVYSLDM